MFESNKGKIDWDKDYPMFRIPASKFKKHSFLKRFLQMPDPPKQIYYRGKFPDENMHFLSVVGSRNITSYGSTAIKNLISGLEGQNICIISGLALGVDGEAHVAGLKANLFSISVPGSGLGKDTIYPQTNRKIAENILLSGGLLLSEFPGDFPTYQSNFPQRNRIMAGLSDAVLLIEASEKSGTLITARLAMEYNKDVLCVPGPIFSENSKGTNRLITEGARLVQDSSDILHQFRISTDTKLTSETAVPENLTETEKSVLKNLNEPISKDSLHNKLNLEIGVFLTTITILEMKGFIKEEMGILHRIR